MPRRRPHTRESIERIRETINTHGAIKVLSEIGHDPKTPPSTRVKALQVLLDKTLPSLTQADVLNQPAQPVSYEELVTQLNQLIGEDQTAKLLSKLSGKKEETNKETKEPESPQPAAYLQ